MMMKMSLKKMRNACMAFIPLFLLLYSGTLVMAQTAKNITGKVVFKDGISAPGVTVIEKGTNNGTSTDANGNYRISVKSDDAVLVFSQVGLTTQEIKLNGRTTLNVTVQEDVSQLNEVVVVGYGTQKKVNLTGAVSVIDAEQLTSRPVPNVTGALQGVAPGVTVLRGSGKPGEEGYGVRIRGFSSVNNAQALVLVDGIEMDMNLLNPDDVESISVLKDASAAAIYGARAAGGVVLVTTKKGSGGKTRINFNTYYGLNITARQPQRLSSWDEQILIDEARFNATGSREYDAEKMEWQKNPNFQYRENPTQDRWEYFGSNDWIKEGMDKYNYMQNQSLSIGGGDQKLNYLVSGSHYKRDGVLRYGPDDNSRNNLSLNVNAKLNKYLDLNLVSSYVGSFVNENSFGTDQIINRLYRSRNRQNLYVPDEDTTGQPYNGDLQINAVDIEKNAGLWTRNYETFQGRFDLKIHDLVKGLAVDLIGWRKQDNYASSRARRSLFWYGRTTNTIRSSINNPNSYELTKNRGFHNNFQGQATYTFDIAKKHNFKILGATSFEEYRQDQFSAGATNMVTNDSFSLNYGDPLTKTNEEQVRTWALSSYYGRLNYNFLEKYLFEATFRYDGSSRLSPQNRWNFFPAFSAGWRISEENFIKNSIPQISNLKLRLSWGQQGNSDAINGNYAYIPLLTSGITTNNNLIFNGQKTQYFYQSTLPSSDLTWETVQQQNIGLDVGLFKEKLTVTVDRYEKRNKNMLATLNLPNIIGIGTSMSNVGELKSWGWEFATKWRDKVQSVNYNIGFNISDNQNKLLRYDGKNSIGNGGVISLLEGYPLNTLWGYKTDGYFQTQAEADTYKGQVDNLFAKLGPGDVKYLDLDGNGSLDAGEGTPENSGDLVNLGTINARYTYGIDLGASWKNIDFSVFFQGTMQRKFLINDRTLSAMAGTADMPWSIHMDRWTPDNPNALFPRMYQTSTHNFLPSDRYAQNGAYLRLKNIQVGYTVPFNKKYIQKLRIYFSGQDLWEKTDVLDVFDPEVGNDASATDYPFYRSASFGLNVTF